MVYIYALMSGQLVLYVGQTKRLKRREWEHRNKKGCSCSKYIPDYMEWTMKILEETTDTLGIQREQYFYDTLKPLYNRQRPGQTKKEYCKIYAQTDTRKIFQKAYRQTDAYKEGNKAYEMSEAGKEYRKAYVKSDARKASQRAYYLKKKLNSVQD